ncbi:MAG: hypothetical protein NC131_14995 [Roseburia sp.]|nr:hypothetical protein [Roseburia sp.]
MEENKNQRGGARQGAGRKKTSAKTVCVRVPADVAAILDAVEGSKTDFIVEAIRSFMSSKG